MIELFLQFKMLQCRLLNSTNTDGRMAFDAHEITGPVTCPDGINRRDELIFYDD